MITEPIKDIIDEYSKIADKNRIEYGKDYANKYGCDNDTKKTNFNFRPSSSDKKSGTNSTGKELMGELDAAIKKSESAPASLSQKASPSPALVQQASSSPALALVEQETTQLSIRDYMDAIN